MDWKVDGKFWESFSMKKKSFEGGIWRNGFEEKGFKVDRGDSRIFLGL
jgi:hypothetical protein